MRTTRIYHPGALNIGQEISLESQAATHVLRVLRCQTGSELILFNGDGKEYRAIISRIHRHHAWANIINVQDVDRESSLSIHLLQGISKGERMDYTIQKAVELGITTITPVLTEHSTVQIKADRLEKRMRHWQGVIHSACEQCGRNRIPVINAPIKLVQCLTRTEDKNSALKLTLEPNATDTLNTVTYDQSDIILLIGPEGGLSENEISLANKKGFTGIRLGPRILRTETAAVTCLSIIQSCWGDLA